jgi:hypothetical protein
MKALRVSVCLSAIMIFLFGITVTPAVAQNNCAPFSGTVYGALYPDAPEAPPTWHAVGDFTIGKDLHRATIGVSTRVGTVPVGPGVILGGEQWTFDFGRGNTVQLLTDFVVEHLTDATGVFHVSEVGQFANGTGAFAHVYGSLTSGGPFGPAVVLPATVTELPRSAILFWIAPTQGMICGSNNRDS